MFEKIFVPRHQRRVNDIYPTHPGEEGAVSAKLSRLTYYVNSKPLKIKKVLFYLESKVKADLDKERTGYNKVSMEIIDALVMSCKDHLRLFGTYALRIVYFLIANGDEELATKATASSRLLCTDSEFRKVLGNLLARYIEMCKYESESVAVERDFRFIGISALKTLIVWEDFVNFDPENRVDDIVFSLLINLKDSQALNVLVTSRKDRSPTSYSASGKRNSIFDEVVTEEGLDKLAVSCLELLIKKASTSYLNSILSSIFSFLDKHEWSPNGLALNVMKIVVYTVQNQALFLVISHIFRILDSPNFANNKGVRNTMIDVLRFVLTSNRSPLGISATEMLSYLLKLLRKSIHLESGKEGTDPTFGENIQNTIDALMGHRDYSNQKFEIVNYLVSRVTTSNGFINSGTTNDDTSSVNTGKLFTLDEKGKYRMFLLSTIAITSKRTNWDKASVASFPLKMVEKLSRLILDSENDVRFHAIAALKELAALDLNMSTLELEESGGNPSGHRCQISDPELSMGLHKKLRYCISKSVLYLSNEPCHYAGLFQLLTALGSTSSPLEIINGMRMMLYLQKAAQVELFRSAPHRFIQNIVLSYLLFAARKLDQKRMVHFFQQLLQDRKNDNQWYSSIELFDETFLRGKALTGIESEGHWKPVEIYPTVEEIINLADEIHGPFKLSETLAFPYDPEIDNLGILPRNFKAIFSFIRIESDTVLQKYIVPRISSINRKNSEIQMKSTSESGSHSDYDSNSISTKELKEAMSLGRKSEKTRQILRKSSLLFGEKKKKGNFSSTSLSQLNTRMEKESEIQSFLDDSEDDIENEIDGIWGASSAPLQSEPLPVRETSYAMEKEPLQRSSDEGRESSDFTSNSNNFLKSNSRETFSNACVLNLQVPDPF